MSRLLSFVIAAVMLVIVVLPTFKDTKNKRYLRSIQQN